MRPLRKEFEPEGASGERLIQGVILNDWFLRRAESRYMETEMALSKTHPLEWTAEQHHKMELMTRYKTSAERSFYRAFNAMRALRKDKFREEISIENLRKVIDRLSTEREQQAQAESNATAETDAPAETDAHLEAVAEVKSKAQPKTRATQRKRPAQIRLFTPKRSEKTMTAQAGDGERSVAILEGTGWRAG